MAWGGGVVCGGEIVWVRGSGAGRRDGLGRRVMCTSFICAGAR